MLLAMRPGRREIMEGEIKDSDIAVIMDDFAKMGFDEEKQDLIRKDLDYGIDLDVVNAYTSLNGDIRKQKLMSKLARKGLDADLAGRFAKLEPEVMKTIGKLMDKGVTIDELHELLKDCRRPYQIQEAIKQFISDLSEKKKTEKTENEELTKPAPKAEENATDKIEESKTVVKEEKSELQPKAEVTNQVDETIDQVSKETATPTKQVEQERVIVHEKPVIIQQPAPETNVDRERYEEEKLKNAHQSVELIMLRRQLNEMEDKVKEKEEQIARIKKDKKSGKKKHKKKYKKQLAEMQTQINSIRVKLMDEKIKRIQERREQQHIKIEEILKSDDIPQSGAMTETFDPAYQAHEQTSHQPEPAPVTPKPASETPKPAPQPMPESIPEPAVNEPKVSTPEPKTFTVPDFHMIPGCQTMIRFADGTVVPVDVDRPAAMDKKAFASVAGRMFGKKSPQNALVRQLINKKLTASQLKVIKRAVQYRFSDRDLKDLIDSDLPAEEMSGIIDVVMANRGAVTEGGGGA